MGLSIEIRMKSGGFHVKSTQNLVKAGVSTKTIQFDECRRGAMTLDFMKSGVIAPSMHPPNWRVFVETSDFIRLWVDFMWNLLDFKIMSFCVMIKYRSFVFRKTKQTSPLTTILYFLVVCIVVENKCISPSLAVIMFYIYSNSANSQQWTRSTDQSILLDMAYWTSLIIVPFH